MHVPLVRNQIFNHYSPNSQTGIRAFSTVLEQLKLPGTNLNKVQERTHKQNYLEIQYNEDFHAMCLFFNGGEFELIKIKLMIGSTMLNNNNDFFFYLIQVDVGFQPFCL